MNCLTEKRSIKTSVLSGFYSSEWITGPQCVVSQFIVGSDCFRASWDCCGQHYIILHYIHLMNDSDDVTLIVKLCKNSRVLSAQCFTVEGHLQIKTFSCKDTELCEVRSLYVSLFLYIAPVRWLL